MNDKTISNEDKVDTQFNSVLGWLAAAAVSIATFANFA
jgi:hypothetical protein